MAFLHEYVAPVLPGGDAGPPRLASPDLVEDPRNVGYALARPSGPRPAVAPTWGAPTPPRRRLPRRRPLPPSKSAIRLPSVLAQMLLVPSEREVARCTEKMSRRRREGRGFQSGRQGRKDIRRAEAHREFSFIGGMTMTALAAGRPRDDGGWAELAVRRAPIAGADRLLRRDGARPDRSEIEGTVLAHARTVLGVLSGDSHIDRVTGEPIHEAKHEGQGKRNVARGER